MKKYFKDKNYIMLYLDNFLSNFANSIYSVFTPVILYKSGVEISIIFFIYAIQFLIMGVFTPLSGLFTKKFGVAITKFISYVLRAISLFFVLTVDMKLFSYLLIAVTHGLAGAINNPLNTFVPSKIVEENFRGRFNAFKYILRCFSSILGYIFVTVFIIKDNNLIIMATVLTSYLLSAISIIKLEKNKFNYGFKSSFKESYNYLLKKDENKKLKIVSGLRSFIIIERLIAIPLYLYISLNDLKTFTVIYVVSTIIELLSLFISGEKMDRDNTKTFSVISFIKGVISSIFIIFKNKYVLLVNQSLYKLVDNVYESAYCSVSQSKVENDETDTLILSMVHEMSLCFYEFVVLSFLTAISSFNSILTFKIIYVFAILVLFVNSKFVKIWK